VLIYNNVLGDPTAMAQDGTPNQPTIPAVMVSETNGLALAGLAPSTATVNGTGEQEFLTDGSSADILASFSSRGPSPFTLSIKPDLTAPGVNVYSSIPAFGCASPPCFAFFQGTSMATPHTAGSAALLVQLHPTWSPAQIKSALVNSAHRPVKNPSSGAALSNPMDRGAGRIDLAAASSTPLTFDPVSVSFGQFTGIPPVGFPQSVSVQNVSGSIQSCSVSTGSSLVGASPSTLNVGANGHATLTLRLNAGGTAGGDYFGDVTITCGSTVLHVPWWVRIS
jgi:minor extracellular serine protease Vpr